MIRIARRKSYRYKQKTHFQACHCHLYTLPNIHSEIKDLNLFPIPRFVLGVEYLQVINELSQMCTRTVCSLDRADESVQHNVLAAAPLCPTLHLHRSFHVVSLVDKCIAKTQCTLAIELVTVIPTLMQIGPELSKDLQRCG